MQRKILKVHFNSHIFKDSLNILYCYRVCVLLNYLTSLPFLKGDKQSNLVIAHLLHIILTYKLLTMDVSSFLESQNTYNFGADN